MGDFIYNGEHSVDIILEDGTKLNTWTNFKLAPMARPFVAAPSIKSEYINVPGMDGALDYTEALTGKVRYTNRTGSWNFILENGNFDWPVIMSNILNKLHGKQVKVILTDDPNFYYSGRLTLNVGFGNKDYSSIVISYNFEPYKTPVDIKVIEDWQWKELFGNTIYYGTFNVNGIKTHTIINDSETNDVCNINVTSTMSVFRCSDNNELWVMINDDFDIVKHPPIYLRAGDNEVALDQGKNMLVFKGYGIATVSYERGKTL